MSTVSDTTKPIVWTCGAVRVDTSYSGVYKYIHELTGVSSLWVVEHVNGTIMVVDGGKGACGEEPVVAGPFETVDDAKAAAEMQDTMGDYKWGVPNYD